MAPISTACLDAFWSASGRDFRWAGVQLQLHDQQRVHMWAEFGTCIAEEEAIHDTY